jgi:hypothetical protein
VIGNLNLMYVAFFDLLILFTSVMAGFAAKGIQDDNFFNIKNLYENRGVSFAMGGVSIPIFINFFFFFF